MRADVEVEKYHGRHAQDAAKEVNRIESKVFGDVSASGDAQPYADVPRGQVSAGGRAALVVGREVDVERVVGREHHAEAYAEHEGHEVEREDAPSVAVADKRGAAREEEERRDDHVEAVGDDLGDVAPVHVFSGEDAAHTHAYGHQGEKESGGHVQADFAGIDGHVVGRGPVGDGQEEQGNAGGYALQQDEAVERDGRPFDRCFARCLDAQGAKETEETVRPVDSRPAQTDQTEQSIQPDVTRPEAPSEDVLTNPTQMPDGTKVESPPVPVEHDAVVTPTEPAVKPDEPQAGDTKNGQIYIPGFGWVQNNGGGGSGTVAEDMYENGRHSFWRNNEIAGEAAIMHAYMCYGKFPYNTKVAVIGRGNVARGAIKTLDYMGATVICYNRHTESLLRQEIGEFDVIVNAVLWDTKRTDHMIYREDLKRMKRNSMIIDISCDRHGGIETSEPTTIEKPTYITDGVIHYVVDHTPSLFYKTTSISISKQVCKYIDDLCCNKQNIR